MIAGHLSSTAVSVRPMYMNEEIIVKVWPYALKASTDPSHASSSVSLLHFRYAPLAQREVVECHWLRAVQEKNRSMGSGGEDGYPPPGLLSYPARGGVQSGPIGWFYLSPPPSVALYRACH